MRFWEAGGRGSSIGWCSWCGGRKLQVGVASCGFGQRAVDIVNIEVGYTLQITTSGVKHRARPTDMGGEGEMLKFFAERRPLYVRKVLTLK